ncbi:MAG: hypothetical protein J0L96_18360 [Anaerolineae bacterium]|nr:hypothetical protein [Anaerolineae bacterium]
MRFNKPIARLFFFFIFILTAACAPAPAANPTPTPDIIGTTAAQLASLMLTQTSAAYTPTLAPVTNTPQPQFTETPTLDPAPAVTAIPLVNGNTQCYAGPGTNYQLVSNISDTEQVEVAGVAHVPGWYVIRNPIYGSLCWISASNMNFSTDFDLTTLPVIYP